MGFVKQQDAPSWEKIDRMGAEPATSLIYAGAGGEGSGKSAFALGMPEPIFVAAFDTHGMKRVDPRFKLNLKGKPKDIRISRYGFNPNHYSGAADVSKAASDLWKKFLDEYHLSLKHARSVILDREDMMYKLQRYAEFGSTSDAPKAYESLYIDYAALLQEAQDANVNVAVLRGLKDKWVSKFDPNKNKMVGHNTGEKIPSGNVMIPDLVDITLFHRWEPGEDGATGKFITTIGKFTQPECREQEYPNLTFWNMAEMAYPDTDASDWRS